MKKQMMIKGSVAALVAAGVLATAAYASGSLTVVSWGGAYQEAQRNTIFKPYADKTGAAVKEEEYTGEIAKIRAMVESGTVSWDVISVDTPTALQGCDEGVLEELDYSRIVDKSKILPGAALDCAIGSDVYATIFAYNTTKFQEGPKTIADFFDLEKFPGKRGMQKNPMNNLEWALIADGVEKDKVYEVLGTPEGVDRAFAKLDTIKSQVVWWEAGAQPPQWLADGEVVMSTAWNGRIANAIKEGAPLQIVWDAQAPDLDMWAIAKGTPNIDAAYDFIAFASTPEVQSALAPSIPYGPTHLDAVALVEPELAKTLPTHPDNLALAYPFSAEFWGDNMEELRARLNTWLAQ
ncbi:putative spermidine/putrescine transport system substrate-binding protein [Dongia mobilis]|uniref:Putative spermidine/putrescine transport system substrate-binding protein n=2 Tax=Dongia mobilis TaxID=578943 RepID=A0A4R6WJB5_9PROT|nr:putative spermidine/putrescine transport system substrate-binding protein [Dongia mobilis]